MEQTRSYKIYFEGVSVAEAGNRAVELRETVLDSTTNVSAKVVKDDPNTQDFGAALVLVLGTPAIIVISKGIADYLRKRGGTIKITTGDGGEVIAENVTSKDAARIAEAFGLNS